MQPSNFNESHRLGETFKLQELHGLSRYEISEFRELLFIKTLIWCSCSEAFSEKCSSRKLKRCSNDNELNDFQNEARARIRFSCNCFNSRSWSIQRRKFITQIRVYRFLTPFTAHSSILRYSRVCHHLHFSFASTMRSSDWLYFVFDSSHRNLF